MPVLKLMHIQPNRVDAHPTSAQADLPHQTVLQDPIARSAYSTQPTAQCQYNAVTYS